MLPLNSLAVAVATAVVVGIAVVVAVAVAVAAVAGGVVAVVLAVAVAVAVTVAVVVVLEGGILKWYQTIDIAWGPGFKGNLILDVVVFKDIRAQINNQLITLKTVLPTNLLLQLTMIQWQAQNILPTKYATN
jgi:hypothetical protein